jgi:hypothetical protein
VEQIKIGQKEEQAQCATWNKIKDKKHQFSQFAQYPNIFAKLCLKNMM